MSRLDEAIEEWTLSEFRKREFHKFDHVGRHLAQCRTTKVAKCNHEVRCECYSEITRDDVWALEVWVVCECGVESRWLFNPRSWMSLPEIIQAIRDADEEAADCRFEGDW